jgi:CBS domain-containing protein
MSLGEVCNREVVIIGKEGSLQEAIQLMRAQHVGDVVVVDERAGRRVPVGIVTDRDVVVEVLAKGIDLGTVAVGDVMSFELVTARESDDVFDTIKLMRARAVRRVPVVDKQGGLVGILTVDDLVDLFAEVMSDIAGLVSRQPKREHKSRP